MRRITGALIILLIAAASRVCDRHATPPTAPADPTRRDSISDAPASRPRKGALENPLAGSPVPADFFRDPLHFLSTAPPDSLVLLPGIGPVIAERIAGARTGKRSFTTWEDLLKIRGIGPKKLENLRRLAGSGS